MLNSNDYNNTQIDELGYIPTLYAENLFVPGIIKLLLRGVCVCGQKIGSV